jgi:hypothetical protein
MSLVLELPAELEARLAVGAARLGLPLEKYALRLLATGLSLNSAPPNGAQLTDNPWHRLPDEPPYVLPDDKLLVESFNVKASQKRFLHIDKILPEAFVGSPTAPVVLLSNNPGFNPEKGEAKLRQDPIFMVRMRNNLQHLPADYPFVFLDPDNVPGMKWWQRKLKRLLKLFGPKVIARSILNVPYFPYPSRRFRHGRLHLPSQDYGFRLVRDAVNRGAMIVSMRSKKRWLSAVPELKEYENLCQVNNVQNPVISPRNCPGYQKVVEAIEQAERKRQS